MRKIVGLSALAALILLSCDLLGGGSSGSSTSGIRTFYAQTLSGSWYTLTADLKYTGTHSLVYVESDWTSEISESLAAQIGMEFDNNIYGMVHTYFASEVDVDNNGKVIILLLDIQDGATDSSDSYVAGYFDPTHMFSSSTYSKSNQADMLFMDVDPGLLDSTGSIDPDSYESLKITMAHEFQHLVNYSERVINQQVGEEDTWINEGLSSASEYIYSGGHISWKIEYYNQEYYQNTYLTGGYLPSRDGFLWGENFLSWYAWDASIVDYSTVYLFFQWLRIHAGNGEGIYKKILDNPSGDYSAVVSAVNSEVSSLSSASWSTIFAAWLLANYKNDASGIYGYDGEFKLYPRYFESLSSADAAAYFGVTDGSVTLFPGEAVFFKGDGTHQSFLDTSSIGFSVIKANASAFGISSEVTTEDVLITRNIVGTPAYYASDYATSAIITTIGGGTSVNSLWNSSLGSGISASSVVKAKSAVGTRRQLPVDSNLSNESSKRIPFFRQ